MVVMLSKIIQAPQMPLAHAADRCNARDRSTSKMLRSKPPRNQTICPSTHLVPAATGWKFTLPKLQIPNSVGPLQATAPFVEQLAEPVEMGYGADVPVGEVTPPVPVADATA